MLDLLKKQSILSCVDNKKAPQFVGALRLFARILFNELFCQPHTQPDDALDMQKLCD